MLLRAFRSVVGILFLVQASVTNAEMTIEIIGAGEYQVPVAIVPFGGDGKLAQAIKDVVVGDLLRSGLFRMVDAEGMSPHAPAEVSYPEWQKRGAEALVIGTVTAKADGRIDARFHLLDAVKQAKLIDQAVSAEDGQLRAIGHRIADLVYEKLTGDRGVFNTRIAYVNRIETKYKLMVADSDGYNEQVVLSQDSPIMSPSWSPDGSHLAYVSFETGHAVVYVQSLYTGQRKVLADFSGSNSAPAWSPDGRRLAVVLTKDGGSQIYLINADGSGTPTRLTSSSAIDTEPNFSPDGQLLLFTSDRGGSPQIYGMSVTGGETRRLTFEGSYNVSPRFSPDGKSFAFIQRNGGRFNVAVQDFATRQVQVLTDGSIDESPSFAPNGRMIVYASGVRGRGILAAVSSDGRVKQRFTENAGDVREPAWGPLVKH